MAGMTALPQTVVHSSQRLSHRQAHDLLSSFLTEADTNPAYRPDATLTTHGITAAGVGSTSNLTLNHLHRILKGIAGERVGSVDFNYGTGPPKKRRKVDHGEPQSSPPEAQKEHVRNGVEVVGRENEDGEDQPAIVGEETGDWQDKEDFEHAQVDETQDLAEQDMADAQGTIEGSTIAADTGSVAGGLTEMEKLARKHAKQERRKQEKKDRNMKKKVR